MFTPLLFSILLSASTAETAADTSCPMDSAQLHASYTINTSDGNHAPHSTTLVLWRNQHTVAHQYPQTGITEAWTRVKKQWLKPVRYFDNHQRAIEYQPGERIQGKVDTDWSYRNQLVSDTYLSTLTLENTSGSGCETVHTYRMGDHKRSVELAWLPALKLVKSFVITQGTTTRSWTLNDVSDDVNEIHRFFDQRRSYKSTDYADIGDDHTDPFLTNMVRQGFIEAGASGFYTADGKAMQAEHSHQ